MCLCEFHPILDGVAHCPTVARGERYEGNCAPEHYPVAVFFFPVPYHLNEFFTSDVMTILAGLGEDFFLDYVLCCDTCVVGTGQPESVESLHPP